MHEKVNVCMSECLNIEINDWMKKSMNEWYPMNDEQLNEDMNEWSLNECMQCVY